MSVETEFCKCRYKHCLYGENSQVRKSEAVRVGNRYYHRECYETKETVNEIIDYFTKEINPDVIHMILMRTINNICFPKERKGIPPERLLFQLKYCMSHGYRIQYPGGLYHVVQNRDSFQAYKKYVAEKSLNNKKASFRVSDEQNQSREGKATLKKVKSFEDILKERR